ncbi:MAG TPA: aldo/keto reductase [Bacillota bacterium]|nr:aldo/keto reductase [Bacillota bacterium]
MSSEAKLGPLTVSRLGFGTLSLSPLQSFHEVDQGAELLCYAWHKGITFWDTAQIYANYPLLCKAIKKLPRLPVVATKTYAYSARGAEAAVDEARRQLDMDVLDIMLLHEQEALTLPGHRPALDWLAGARERGLIRAVGVSTHSVACVLAAAELDEIDVIHPLYNKWGLGICDGSARDMAAAIARARRRGKGIYAMKVLGGGAMYRRAREAIRHVLQQPWLDSMVIGMSTAAEVDFNLAVLEGRTPPPGLARRVRGRSRRLHVAEWCQGCGLCLPACSQGALQLAGDKVTVQAERCVLCGYCCRACPHVCLKII